MNSIAFRGSNFALSIMTTTINFDSDYEKRET